MRTRYGSLPVVELEPGRVVVGHGEGVQMKATIPKLPLMLGGYTFKTKLEHRYALHLEERRAIREILDWRYEFVSFRLPGPKNFYKPDFLLTLPDGSLQFIEVKGFHPNMRESQTKCKTAAGLTPWATFIWVTRQRGCWIEKKVG